MASKARVRFANQPEASTSEKSKRSNKVARENIDDLEPMYLNRSVLRWLQTLDLSQPSNDPRNAFASGYLVAELVAKFERPDIITANSYTNFLKT